MTYFVTGATGFIGRHLVERLLEREGDIYVLVREGSREQARRGCSSSCGAGRTASSRSIGDLAQPQLGVDDADARGARRASTTSSTSPRSTT